MHVVSLQGKIASETANCGSKWLGVSTQTQTWLACPSGAFGRTGEDTQIKNSSGWKIISKEAEVFLLN